MNAFEKTIEELLVHGEMNFVERKLPVSLAQARAIVQPDVRRIATMCMLASSLPEGGKATQVARGLEVGVGYAGLLLSLARTMPRIHWHGLEHPGREYVRNEAYVDALRVQGCELHLADLAEDVIPFRDESFRIVTFSEVLEHLPTSHVLQTLRDISRVLEPGGWLIASSPNLVQLMHRIQMLRGRSMLDLPLPLSWAADTYGHVRMYTIEEFATLGARVRLRLCQVRYESRRPLWPYHANLPRRIAVAGIGLLERALGFLGARVGDTWYCVMQKRADGSE